MLRRALPLALLLLATPALAQQPAPRPAQSAPSGADVQVRGIENTIATLNSLKGNRDAAQAALVLQLLRGMGRKAPSDDGRSRLDYHVEVTQDGRVMVNDVDISTLTDMLAKKPKG